MENEPLPTYLRSYRRRLGLTQHDVALLLGSNSPTTVSRHELGGQQPTLRTAIRYGLVLGASTSELFAGMVQVEARRVRRRARQLIGRSTDGTATIRVLAELRSERIRGPLVLALDRTRRGFAYACLEGSTRLVEWGQVEVGRSGTRWSRALRLAGRLRPGLLVLSERDRFTWPEAVEVESVKITWVGKEDVRRTFSMSGTTKEDIADELVRRFPELRRMRPPRRRVWMAADNRMNVFDAVALGLTALRTRRRRHESESWAA